MSKLLFIFFGGGIGSLLRYSVSGFAHKFSSGVFPIGTFVVNITGSLLIGFLWVIFEMSDMSSAARVGVFVGILGGFTTFSAFSIENMNLLRDGQLKVAFLNIIATNFIALTFVFIGFFAAKSLIQIFH